MVNFNSDFTSNSGDNLPPELRAKIEAAFGAADAKGGLAALNSKLQQDFGAYNDTPQADLGGFSPTMLSALQQHDWIHLDCPLKLSGKLSNEQLVNAAFFQQIRTFLITLNDSGGIKATAKGNLPRSFVTTMVDVFLSGKEKETTLRINKVLNEPDIFSLHEARIVCKLAGLIGLNKGHYKFHKNRVRLLEPEAAGTLYKLLFVTFFRKYNLGYRYNFGVNLDWLQQEAGYILMPLQQHADKWIDPSAHTKKWLHPMVLERLEEALCNRPYIDVMDVIKLYFINPFKKWGLLEIERKKEHYLDKIQRIRKTPLFDAFIEFKM